MGSTYMAKKEDVNRDWTLVDVKDQTLGRAASTISHILRGKHRATYTPHVDTGDFVVVINAKQVRLSGNKDDDKIYYSHSGYMGGIKSVTAKELRKKDPERIIRSAVKGMLPKNKLGKSMLKKLKIYSDTDHPHKAQNPKEIKLNG